MPIDGSPTCDACTARDFCGEEAVVFTCLTCSEKVCSPKVGLDMTAPAPEGCPKWHPSFGASFDCGACAQDRHALRMSHPARAAGMEAVSNLVRAWLDQIAAEEAGVDPSAARASFKEAMVALSDATDPFRHVRATDAEFEEALTFVRQFVALAMGEPEFKEEVSRNTTWDTSLHELRWVEEIILARRRRADVVRTWLLLFTEWSPWVRARGRLAVPRRPHLLRQWTALVRTRATQPLLAEG